MANKAGTYVIICGIPGHADSAGLNVELPTQTLLALDTRARNVVLTKMGDGVWDRTGSGPWSDISAGLPVRHAMPLVALPGSRGAVLYAGTMGYGVYVKQGDVAWQPFGRGLTGVENTILGLAVASQGPESFSLVAATASGVSRYTLARQQP